MGYGPSLTLFFDYAEDFNGGIRFSLLLITCDSNKELLELLQNITSQVFIDMYLSPTTYVVFKTLPAPAKLAADFFTALGRPSILRLECSSLTEEILFYTYVNPYQMLGVWSLCKCGHVSKTQVIYNRFCQSLQLRNFWPSPESMKIE